MIARVRKTVSWDELCKTRRWQFPGLASAEFVDLPVPDECTYYSGHPEMWFSKVYGALTGMTVEFIPDADQEHPVPSKVEMTLLYADIISAIDAFKSLSAAVVPVDGVDSQNRNRNALETFLDGIRRQFERSVRDKIAVPVPELSSSET